MVPLIAFIFGSFIGSFLNVCIHRLPRNESVVTPPSRCYGCGTRVQWYDNIPVLSYAILRGKCRWCGTGFSPRYLVMELMAGALSAVVMGWAFDHDNTVAPASWLYVALGATPMAELVARACAGAAVLSLAYYLLVAAMIDVEHFIIPDELTKSFQVLGPALAVLVGSNLAYGDFSWLANWLFVPGSVNGGAAWSFSGGRFLAHVGALIGTVLVLLLASTIAARWIYQRHSTAAMPWNDEEQRGLRIGVVWFCACTALSLAGLAAIVLIQPGPAAGHGPGQAPWWPLLSLHLAQALCGSLAGWLALYVVGLLGTLVFRRNAMGFGDVKFLAPIGALLGPVGVLYAFFAAALVGTLISLPRRLMHEAREIPFGPFLAIGSLLVLYGGPRFHHWLLMPLLH